MPLLPVRQEKITILYFPFHTVFSNVHYGGSEMEMSEKTIKLKPYITLEEEDKTKSKNRNETIIK